MKISNSVGELVYIPSQTKLHKIKDGVTTAAHVLEKPINVLIFDEDQYNKVGVFYNGEKWYVSERDIYDIKLNQINRNS